MIGETVLLALIAVAIAAATSARVIRTSFRRSGLTEVPQMFDTVTKVRASVVDIEARLRDLTTSNDALRAQLRTQQETLMEILALIRPQYFRQAPPA